MDFEDDQQTCLLTAQSQQVLRNLLIQLHKVFDWQTEGGLTKKLSVKHSGENIFSMRNFGKATRGRANSFSYKEPETLSWIDSFSVGESLLDIGANVGACTLYAAKKGIEVKAIEPDALNFALLYFNIHDNHLIDFNPDKCDVLWFGTVNVIARNLRFGLA